MAWQLVTEQERVYTYTLTNPIKVTKWKNDLFAGLFTTHTIWFTLVQKLLFAQILPCSAQSVQICPVLNANEIQIPYDKHCKVSSLVKCHQYSHNPVKYEVILWKMSNNPAKYEALIKQHLHWILDISESV